MVWGPRRISRQSTNVTPEAVEMSSEYQIIQCASISEVDIEKLMAEARAERAKLVRGLLAKVFRRQTLPAWNQPALQAS